MPKPPLTFAKCPLSLVSLVSLAAKDCPANGGTSPWMCAASRGYKDAKLALSEAGPHVIGGPFFGGIPSVICHM